LVFRKTEKKKGISANSDTAEKAAESELSGTAGTQRHDRKSPLVRCSSSIVQKSATVSGSGACVAMKRPLAVKLALT
jgi:hypothetical protein